LQPSIGAIDRQIQYRILAWKNQDKISNISGGFLS